MEANRRGFIAALLGGIPALSWCGWRKRGWPWHWGTLTFPYHFSGIEETIRASAFDEFLDEAMRIDKPLLQPKWIIPPNPRQLARWLRIAR